MLVVKIPGNVLTPGSWQVVRFIDERATDEQMAAILDAYRGHLGGPLADLAGLIGEELAVERAARNGAISAFTASPMPSVPRPSNAGSERSTSKVTQHRRGLP